MEALGSWLVVFRLFLLPPPPRLNSIWGDKKSWFGLFGWLNWMRRGSNTDSTTLFGDRPFEDDRVHIYKNQDCPNILENKVQKVKKKFLFGSDVLKKIKITWASLSLVTHTCACTHTQLQYTLPEMMYIYILYTFSDVQCIQIHVFLELPSSVHRPSL